MHMYIMCDITKMQHCLFLADDGGGVFRCACQMPARQLCSAMKTCYMYKIKLNLTFIVAPLKNMCEHKTCSSNGQLTSLGQ